LLPERDFQKPRAAAPGPRLGLNRAKSSYAAQRRTRPRTPDGGTRISWSGDVVDVMATREHTSNLHDWGLPAMADRWSGADRFARRRELVEEHIEAPR
jgi:hypothetical protein